VRVAIYVRVSTADQHVESQLYDLRELASRRSFEVVKVYQDCGVSGRRARRPGLEQRAPGTMLIWSNPFTSLRVPKIFNLRTDPYERADITSNTYYDWLLDHAFLPVPAQDYVGQFLVTFKAYPQRQKAASFNMDEVLANLKESGGSK
jgi:resolvase-like protein